MKPIDTAETRPTLLRAALLANAVFFAVYGVLHLICPGFLANLSGISSPIPRSAVWAIIGVDAVMALAGFGALLTRESIGLSASGAWFSAAVTGAFALMALLQYLGLRSLRESFLNDPANPATGD